MQILTLLLIPTEELEAMRMKLSRTCTKVRECAKCKGDIYTFEPRWNKNNGRCEHLKGECK